MLPRRLPAPIEAATYYVCAEAVTSAVKHARATCVWLRVVDDSSALTVTVRDDGVGGACIDCQEEATGLGARRPCRDARWDARGRQSRRVGTTLTAVFPVPSTCNVGRWPCLGATGGRSPSSPTCSTRAARSPRTCNGRRSRIRGARRASRNRDVREAREPPADRGVQGARGRQPRRAPDAGRAARADRRVDGTTANRWGSQGACSASG